MQLGILEFLLEFLGGIFKPRIPLGNSRIPAVFRGNSRF